MAAGAGERLVSLPAAQLSPAGRLRGASAWHLGCTLSATARSKNGFYEEKDFIGCQIEY